MSFSPLRRPLLEASRSPELKAWVQNSALTRPLVDRFVAGAQVPDAVAAALTVVADGRNVTIDYLGEDTLNRADALAVRDEYLRLLTALTQAGLTTGGSTEVSVKLSALGQLVPGAGSLAEDLAAEICAAARAAGTTVTVDAESHSQTEQTLLTIARLRTDFPETGAVVQAYLRRTLGDCRDLAVAGSRVRLCKGAYDEPVSVAYDTTREVDRNFVRCLKVLMRGRGYPMVATHDPRLIDITGALAVQTQRAADSYEYQFLHGIRTEEQRRLAELGERVRVYLPYGDDWYGYLVRRMAERPANTAVLVRALMSSR